MKNDSKTGFIVLIAIAIVLGIVGTFIALRLTQEEPTTPQEGEAAGCTYGSTQARVQCEPWQSCPWKSSLTIKAGETFRIASFHDGGDTVASDTRLVVTNPSGQTLVDCTNTAGTQFQCNTKVVSSTNTGGNYKLTVTTTNQTGTACTGTANVTVQGNVTEPQVCPYGSTQAQVQKDITDPWKGSLQIDVGDTFRIGSFHDGSGNFAEDTKLVVTAPGGTQLVSCNGTSNDGACNGKTVAANTQGTYTFTVTTNDQTGGGCQATGTVVAGTATSSSSSSGGVVVLPRTAIVGESEDRVLVAGGILALGVFILIYGYRLRKKI